MLRLIPAPLARIAYRAAHGLRVRWWRWHKPRLTGCRVLAFDPDGALLLVRHSYGSGRWTLPGGGVKRRETPLAAAARELLEETGCVLEGASEIAFVEEPLQGACNRVHVIAGETADAARADRREIVEARFFPLDRLPQTMPERLRQAIPGWLALR